MEPINGETYQREFWPNWLYDVSDEYTKHSELLIRVDIVPLSNTFAQAAIESGWGTSRYLREGNALYTNTFDESLGLKPQDIDKDKDFYA